jgi:hypothetical protein
VRSPSPADERCCWPSSTWARREEEAGQANGVDGGWGWESAEQGPRQRCGEEAWSDTIIAKVDGGST